MNSLDTAREVVDQLIDKLVPEFPQWRVTWGQFDGLATAWRLRDQETLQRYRAVANPLVVAAATSLLYALRDLEKLEEATRKQASEIPKLGNSDGPIA